MRANNIKTKICAIAGMPRAATTFLYHTLALHPEIFVPSRKELEFFSINYNRGESWYLDFFKEMKNNDVGFDISPMYFFATSVPQRMLAFNPKIKVILLIRDPIEFIISFFKNRQATTYKSLNFETFLKAFEYEKDGTSLSIRFDQNIIKNRILDYVNAFGDNLLLGDFNAFATDPLSLLKAIEKHIEVSEYFQQGNFENIKINASDQRGFKVINKLMHQKLFADIVAKLFPKALIMNVRYRLQSGSSPEKTNHNSNEYSLYRQEMISQFQNDTDFINMIFKDHSYINANQIDSIH
jgi:hypothetical protein